MACYVDDYRAPLGRMKMSHLLADTPAELLTMVDAIGVPRRYIQHAGTSREHFDVAEVKRKAAIARGARPVSSRQLVEIMRRKRAEGLPV